MPNGAYIIIIFKLYIFYGEFKKNSLYIFIKNYVWNWKVPLLSFELSAHNWTCPRTFMSTLGNNWTTSLFGAGNGVRISEIKLIGTNVAHFLCPLFCSFFLFFVCFFFLWRNCCPRLSIRFFLTEGYRPAARSSLLIK